MKQELTKKIINKSYRTSFIRVYEEHINKDEIKQILDNIKSIKQYAFILHDKDKLANGIDIKKSHFHILIRFNTPTMGRDFIPKLSKVKLIDVNAFEKINDSGIYLETAKSFKNCLLYLIHANNKSKYQYLSSEVIASFDYENEIKEEFENNRDNYVRDQIENYTMGKINLIELRRNINELEFLKYDSLIYRASRVRLDYLKRLTRNVNVLYYYGEGGVGKTLWAKLTLLDEYKEDDIFISSSSNDVLDGYEGQRAIIFDDLRGDSFKFHDLLKMLDNHTSSKVKSRYLNKYIEAETIIITTSKTPWELYNFVEMEYNDYIQYRRRISLVLYFEKIPNTKFEGIQDFKLYEVFNDNWKEHERKLIISKIPKIMLDYMYNNKKEFPKMDRERVLKLITKGEKK